MDYKIIAVLPQTSQTVDTWVRYSLSLFLPMQLFATFYHFRRHNVIYVSLVVCWITHCLETHISTDSPTYVYLRSQWHYVKPPTVSDLESPPVRFVIVGYTHFFGLFSNLENIIIRVASAKSNFPDKREFFQLAILFDSN